MIGIPFVLSFAVILSATGPRDTSVTELDRTGTAAGVPVDLALKLTGADKPRHAAMSFAIVLFGSAGASLAGFDRDASIAIGVGASAVAGIGKEMYDRWRGHGADPADLLWNAVGLLAGWMLATQMRS